MHCLKMPPKERRQNTEQKIPLTELNSTTDIIYMPVTVSFHYNHSQNVHANTYKITMEFVVHWSYRRSYEPKTPC